MKKVITKNKYISIAGLLHLAQEAMRKVEECEKAYIKIVGKEQTNGLDSGHFGDAIWNNGNVDEVLEKEGIKVK